MFFQLLINGVITGGVYAIAALGFAMVYNTTRIFHIAYSILYVFAAYMVLTFYKNLQWHLGISVLMAIALTVILSVMIEIMVYKPLLFRKSSLSVMMISSIGVMIMVINLIALFYGNETKIIHSQISGSIKVGRLILTHTQMIQFVISFALIVIFLFFLKFSQFGIKTRAMRDDPDLCEVFSLDIPRLRIELFALSGFFAAVSGILVAYDVGMDPYVGMPMLLNAVVALIIGGIGNFKAPIVGGYIIGILQALSIWFISANWQDAVAFTLLILFLIFRPQGMFGERRRLV